MNTGKDRPRFKVKYAKPTAVDLGAAAPVLGASCVVGEGVGQGVCDPTGNSAGGYCADGNGATSECRETGNAAAVCAGVGSGDSNTCNAADSP
jgi:hypothetical protein